MTTIEALLRRSALARAPNSYTTASTARSALLALVLAFAPSESSAASPPPPDPVTEARHALDAGAPQQALAILSPLLARESSPGERATAHALAAEACARLEDPEGALDHLKVVRELGAADLVDSNRLLEAWALTAVGEPEEALERLEPLASGRTGDRLEPAIALALAEARIAAGDSSGALSLLEKAVAKEPTPDALYRLAVLDFERGAYERAAELLDRVLELRPDDYYAAIYRARALVALERPLEVHAVLAPFRAGGTPEVLYLSGRARFLASDFVAAAELYREVLVRDASYLEASYGLALSLRKLGRTDEAKEELARFAKLRRDEAERRRRAHTLEQRAVTSARDAAPAMELARFFLESKEADRALPWAWRAVRRSSGGIDARLLLARVESARGRYANAATQYRRILESEPDHADARRELLRLVSEHAERRPREKGER